MDKVLIEGEWRPLQYEAVYWQNFADGLAARERIGSWMAAHDHERP